MASDKLPDEIEAKVQAAGLKMVEGCGDKNCEICSDHVSRITENLRPVLLEAYAAGQREMRERAKLRLDEKVEKLRNAVVGSADISCQDLEVAHQLISRTRRDAALVRDTPISPPSASAPPATGDTRSIQEVLRLHVCSSESMEGTYERVGTKEELAYQKGITVGLKRAIEVADYRDDKASAPPVEVPGKKPR